MPVSSLLALLFQAYRLIIIVRVVLSWVRLPSNHPVLLAIGPVIYGLTEPLLQPLRRWLRPYQGNMLLDFSPLLLLLGVSLIEGVVLRVLSVIRL